MRLLKIIFFIFLFFNNLQAGPNYFNEGLTFYEKKELDKAKFKFEQDIVFNPKNEKSYLYLSKIFKARQALPNAAVHKVYAFRRTFPNHIWLQFVAMEF